MSESDFEFEDEAQDQATRNPVRARMRELEDRNKALEAQAKEAEGAKRELAFVKAGVDPDAAGAKWFVKGYDGEFTAEAIRAAAEEANLIPSQKRKWLPNSRHGIGWLRPVVQARQAMHRLTIRNVLMLQNPRMK